MHFLFLVLSRLASAFYVFKMLPMGTDAINSKFVVKMEQAGKEMV